MAVFKRETCPTCKYRRHESKPTTPGLCPRCLKTGVEVRMYYSEQWYMCYQHLGRKYVKAVDHRVTETRTAHSKHKVLIREGRWFDEQRQDIPYLDAKQRLLSSFHSSPGRSKNRGALSPATSRMYENSLGILERHGFDKRPLPRAGEQKIERYLDAVSDFIDARLDEGVTNSTINRDLATLKRMAGLSKCHDVFGGIELLPENKARDRFLTLAEQKELLAQARSSRMRMKLLLALDTGLRKQGVYHLSRTDLNFDTRKIRRVVKGGKEVYIPMTARLYNALKTYIAELDARAQQTGLHSIYLFPSTTIPGKPIRSDSTNRDFKAVCASAGINDFRFHDLRHTFASWFLVRTKDWKSLQLILGHADIRITMNRYAHLLDEHVNEAMKVYEGDEDLGLQWAANDHVVVQ